MAVSLGYDFNLRSSRSRHQNFCQRPALACIACLEWQGILHYASTLENWVGREPRPVEAAEMAGLVMKIRLQSKFNLWGKTLVKYAGG